MPKTASSKARELDAPPNVKGRAYVFHGTLVLHMGSPSVNPQQLLLKELTFSKSAKGIILHETWKEMRLDDSGLIVPMV